MSLKIYNGDHVETVSLKIYNGDHVETVSLKNYDGNYIETVSLKIYDGNYIETASLKIYNGNYMETVSLKIFARAHGFGNPVGKLGKTTTTIRRIQNTHPPTLTQYGAPLRGASLNKLNSNVFNVSKN